MMSQDQTQTEASPAVEQGVHNYSSEDKWIKPEDPLLLERLEWFKDQKLGLMMHWGPYSQIGIVESWALSDEDADWSRADIEWDIDGEEMKREYFELNKTFNPIRFEPEKWAELAADNGFKYLNFTTKHHDGFCMWNTRTTEYRITGRDCPFSRHKYADITKHLFDAFRARGLASRLISPRQTGILPIIGRKVWNEETRHHGVRAITLRSTLGYGRNLYSLHMSRLWS